MDILYLAANTTVPTWFASIAEPWGLRVIPYQAGESDLSGVGVLLLFSPFYVEGQYLSPDAVWKKYCSTEHPNLKVVTASFAVQPAANCLELSDLPDDLAAFFEVALPAKTDWQSADTGGLDMMDVLRRFFSGHGAESLMKEFDNLLSTARNIQLSIKYRIAPEKIFERHLIDGDMKRYWQTFVSRWQRYRLLFEGLPFYPTFQEIEGLVRSIAPFFESSDYDLDLYTKTGCNTAIEAIKQKLESIIPYVEGVS